MMMQAELQPGATVLQPSATVLPVIREPRIWHPMIVAGALRKVTKELFDPYRPERHYMRGPGPRWHEKHGASGFVSH